MKIILVILGITILQFICFILSECLLYIDDTFFNQKILFKESIKDFINSKDIKGIMIYMSPLVLVVSVILTIGLFMTIPFKLLPKNN